MNRLTSEQWRQVRDLFEAAVEQPPGDVAAWLVARTSDDAVRREVASLLAAHANAGAFLTHGGANSFMEAIAANVPMLLSPMCNDQFHQAHFLTRSQIGIAADLRTMSEGEIRNAIERQKFIMKELGAERRVPVAPGPLDRLAERPGEFLFSALAGRLGADIDAPGRLVDDEDVA